jgi:signal transduction histidine kinase
MTGIRKGAPVAAQETRGGSADVQDAPGNSPPGGRPAAEERTLRERISKLQAITGALSEALLPTEVADVVANQMAVTLGASEAMIALPEASGTRLVIVSQSGLSDETMARFGAFAIDADLPAAAAFRTRSSSWTHSKDELCRLYPSLLARKNAMRVESTACLPLLVKGETLGVLAFGFRDPRAFGPDERATAEDLATQTALALERARLYEAERSARKNAEQREREMEMLFRLAETTAAARELNALFEEVLNGVRDVLGVERASILLCDEAGIMRFRAWRGLSDKYRQTLERHTPWASKATEARPIFIADTSEDESMAAYRSTFAAEGIRAIGFIPIIGEGRLLGRFVIYAASPRMFSSHEEHLATTIASHIAQAVARLQALEAERATARRLESLARISRCFVEAGLDTLRLSQAIVTELGKTFDGLAGLSLVSENDGTLRSMAFYHPQEEAGRLFDEASRESPMQTGAGIAGRVVQSGESVMIQSSDPTELAERVTPAFQTLLKRFPLYGLICVPIRFGDRILGTLLVARTEAGFPYAPDDVALCEELADRAALALTNARHFEQAAKAKQAREDVLAVVTHDLRNPLGAILLSAASALRLELTDKKAPRVRKNLATIHRSAERMARLLGDLVDFAAVQSGHLKIEPVLFEPIEVVDAVLEMFVSLAHERTIQLDFEVAPGLPLISADKDRLIQALAYLTSNAIKVTANGGHVRFGVHARSGELIFSVEDTGPGIGPEELPHIFERYWRGREAAYRGTGLGLTIAKGIVEAHGGRIGANSTLGKGSTFSFSVPCNVDPSRPLTRSGAA